MEVVSNIANGFIGLFNAGGETFMGWVTGIIPLVICLMTAVNAVIGFIGVERVEGFCQKITKYTILRYTLLPVMADIFLTNPAQYTFGRFLKKEHKAAFYDASVSFCHPITGLFLMRMQVSYSYTWELHQVFRKQDIPLVDLQ